MARLTYGGRPFPLLWRVFRQRDEGSGTITSFIVGAAVFMLSTTLLVNFLAEPTGSTASLETISLREKGFQAMDVLLGSPGYPTTWSASSIETEAISRLGLLDAGSALRIDANKFDLLAKGSYGSPSRTNGHVDYEEAKKALGLAGYEFHLRVAPVFDAFDPTTFGIEGMEDYHVGYVGHWDGAVESPQSQLERGALSALKPHILYTNLTRLAPVGVGDAYKDDSQSLRSTLVPLLGTHPAQTVIRGNDNDADFTMVNDTVYREVFDPLLEPTLSRALVLAKDGPVLGYSRNSEMRALLGTANMTGLLTAELTWDEWVDANDPNDYGWVEVSPNGGATWYALTNTELLRSQDHAGAPQVPEKAFKPRAVTISAANCPACLNAPEILVALHWTSDNNGIHSGKGWIVDNLQLAPTTVTSFSKDFERPEFDLLIIGSQVDQNAFTAAEVKHAIRDYVNDYGGRLVVLGGQQNTNWLQPLFHVGIRSASGGVSAPDTTHPLLMTPNELDWRKYDNNGKEWDFTGGDSEQLFNPVLTSQGGGHVLSASKGGAFSAGGQEGVVMLTTYLPWKMSGDEDLRFIANLLMYGRYHYLFLDYGPEVPDDQPVASVSRTAIMDKTRAGEGSYIEMSLVLYTWQGGPTTDIATATAVPDRPWNLSIDGGVGRVFLNWTAPSYNGSAQISKYFVYRSTQPGSQQYLAEVSNATYRPALVEGNLSFVDTTVTNGVTYYYNVTAYNSFGQSASSVEVSATPSGLAGMPQGFTATGDAGLTHLSWTQPTDNGGSTISGYQIYRNATGNIDDLRPYTQLGNVLSWQDTDVRPTVTYKYAVAAMNAVGPGIRTAGATATPTATPDAPVVTATGYYRSVVLTWAPPPNPGGPISHYIVYAGRSTDTIALLDDDVTTPSYTHAPLGDLETWYYRVSAVNDVDEGPPSAIESATTIVLPGQPTSVTATAVGMGPGSLKLTWGPPLDTGGGTITGYTVWASSSSGTQTNVTFLPGVATYQYVETGLAANATRFYKVSASTAAGEGPKSAETSAKADGVPYPPVTLAAVAGTGNGRLVITYTPPTENGGEPVTSYRVYYKRTIDPSYTLWGTLPANLEITGLAKTTAYNVYLVAVNGVGQSNASNVVTGISS